MRAEAAAAAVAVVVAAVGAVSTSTGLAPAASTPELKTSETCLKPSHPQADKE